MKKGDQWVPLDPEREYTIASHNFLRRGGDGYTLFKSNAKDAYDFGPNIEDVVIEYLAEIGDYEPKLDGRITLE